MSDSDLDLVARPAASGDLRSTKTTTQSVFLNGAMSLMLLLASFGYSSLYCDNSLFTTDATDYLRAVDGGFWGNYLDTQSMGLWGVISTVRRSPEIRSRLWDYLLRQDDAAAKRHFHVAFGFYPNVLARAWGNGDRVQRLATALEGSLTVAIIFLGLRIAGVRMLLALLAGFLVGMSPSVVTTTTDVSPHTVFLAAVMTAGFALARFLQTEKQGPALMAAAAFALAVATLELSLVTAAVFGVVIALRLFRRGSRETISTFKHPALVFLVVLVLAWPGGVIRGGYLLSYAVFVFQALFRREGYFGDDPFMMTLMRAGQGSWFGVEAIAMTAVAALLLLFMHRFNPYLQVFGLLTLGFAVQGVLNHFRSGTYASHFIASVWVLFALCAQQWLDTAKGSKRYAVWTATALGVMLALLAACGWPAMSMLMKQEQRSVSTRAEQVIGFIKRTLPAGATIVSNRYDGLWRYYMPAYHIEKATGSDNLEVRSWAGLQSYYIIADLESLNTTWRDKLHANAENTVGGFVVAYLDSAKIETTVKQHDPK